MPKAPTIAANGAQIPAIGLGTWPMRGSECTEAVATALAAGYRHIDTAASYANEAEVGAGIRRSELARADIFLTTKVWWENLAADRFLRSTEASLKALATPYVDLLLIHWPSRTVPLAETIGALNKAKRQGLARHIGISNFPTRMIEEAVKLSEEPLVCNQVEYHPHLDQSKVLAACRRHGLAVVAYCPLGRGSIGGVLAEPALAEIARAHGRQPSQVALRWLVQQAGVAAVPKSVTAERIRSNLDVFDFTLSAGEMARIAALARPNGRVVNLDFAPQWD